MNWSWKPAGLVALLLGILTTAAGTTHGRHEPPTASNPAELRITFDDTSGLPASIVSRVGGRERDWLRGPVRLVVTDEASRKGEALSEARVRLTEDGLEADAELSSLEIGYSHRFQVAGCRATWDMTFTGDAPRTGHEIALELPVIFPAARIFTPSQYGVMDVAAYPSFRPVAYATYGWDDGQAYVLPLVTVMDPASDNALTVALSADANIPHLQVEWTGARSLHLTMGHRGIGGGKPTALRLLFYVHPADYRCALKVYSDDFPAYFRPPLPRGSYEGTFWYHHIQAHPEFEEMARQHVRLIWTSFWFTHMGEFLPEAEVWYPYTYARWFATKEMMSDEKINTFIRKMHSHGIGTYAYFNVTEFGGAGGEKGDTADADRMLSEQLADALVRNEQGDTIRTWEASKVMNPGRGYSLWTILEEQIQRHLARIPEFDGFMVDRLDWASGFDYGHDDGLSMIGSRPVENLAVPVAAAVQELCCMAHEAGKRVIVNQFWRVELIRDTDGYCHENDYLPAMAYLAPFRPASAWHQRRGYTGDLLLFEGQMKRRLHWALFPQMIAHEFPICQQEPNPRAADLMEIFAPLFEPLIGKEQVLQAHCVAVTGANDANLFINGAGHYVVPVTSRIRFMSRSPQVLEPAEVTIDRPDARDLRWAYVFSADTVPYRAAVTIKDGKACISVEKHGTASVVVVGKGEEPALELADAERLQSLRRKLFPDVSGRAKAAERPAVTDMVETALEIDSAPIGASGPATVVDVTVDDQIAGQLRDAAGSFRRVAPATELPLEPPVIGLVPGDDGTWLVPEVVRLIARTKTGPAYVVATWEPGDPCGAQGERGLRLPLSWREPRELVPTSARFLAADEETGGAWHGKVGAAAYWMPGVREGEAQSGFRLQVMRGRAYAWSYRVRGDTRVLQNPSDAAASRQATCWFDPDQLELRVDPPNGTPYRLSLYLLDYDRNGRTARVTLTTRSEALDSRDVSAAQTEGGVYLSWTAAGPVVIRVRNTGGANAVVSAVFLDSP
ncbi:MAG: hypothetical protein AB1486_22320 [Planctomycetota bacterium]